ncbi:borderless [Carabus blaptoides fortunei]
MVFHTRIVSSLCCVWFCFGVVQPWYEEEEKPSFLTANVGEHVVFNCELNFPQDIPIVYILKWNKDGKSIFSWSEGRLLADEPFIGRITLVDSDGYGKGSVNLTSIRESDFGWYQCRVLFPNRNPSSRNNGTWYYLTVTGGNLLEIPPINKTCYEGEEATFACVAKEKETTIVWYKDGTPIQDLSDLRSRSTEYEDGTLTIRSTTMYDLGEYECEIVSSSGERQTARAFLDVQYKAKVIYAPKEVYLPFGRPAILDCHFRANPPLTNLRWEKDGFLFDPYNVQGVFYKRNGSLYFSVIDETHSGLYSCTPYNDLGTHGPSAPTKVIVQRAPIFTITPNNLYLKKLGEMLEMPCDGRDGDGGHKPNIVWYRKDGSPLPDGRFTVEAGNITIYDIQEEDRGMYQCSVSNEAATITTETELMVETVSPRAAFNLTATSTQNTVTVKWIAGYSRPHLSYSVWYRPVNTEEWRTAKVEGRRKLEHTVTDLNPGRDYEFMVLSKENLDEGMFSKTIIVTTKGPSFDNPEIIQGEETFAPIGPPRNVSVHLTMNGYLVTWEPPEFGKQSVRVYIVRWTEGPSELLCGTVETKDLFYTVQNLEEGLTYYFRVSALSTDDYQATSDQVTIVVPAYKRVRAISMGIMGAVALLGTAFAAFYYARKKCFKPYEDSKHHINKDGNIS